MPLLPGKENIGHNIKEMEKNHPRAQAVAAALRTAYGPQKRADGGHVGALRGNTPGRADEIKTKVEDGSYIIPAKTVAFLGDGNSAAGFAVLERMFPDSVPHRAWGGATGMSGMPKTPGIKPLPGVPRPHITGLTMPHLAGTGIRKPPAPHMVMAKGGTPKHVDVALSDGEFCVSRASCLKLGDGDLDRAHRALDQFVVDCSKEAAKKEKELPPPVGSHVKK